MATTEKSHQDTPNQILFPGLDAELMQSATDACEAWLRCMLMINTEAGTFLTKRLQRDAQLPLSIVECHSPQDAIQAQIEFFKTMAEDYSREANNMGRIVSECMHSIDRPHSLERPQPTEARTIQHRRAA